MFDALIDLIGLDATEILLHLYGGSELYIPVNDGCQLSEQVGQVAFDQLRKQHGGDRIWIPQGKSKFNEARDRKILEQSGKLTVRELSARFRVGPRRIYQILSEAR